MLFTSLATDHSHSHQGIFLGFSFHSKVFIKIRLNNSVLSLDPLLGERTE